MKKFLKATLLSFGILASTYFLAETSNHNTENGQTAQDLNNIPGHHSIAFDLYNIPGHHSIAYDL
ncbi:hypothetical protein RYX56_12590, partial [Alkalihalophilus lindianensis]